MFIWRLKGVMDWSLEHTSWTARRLCIHYWSHLSPLERRWIFVDDFSSIIIWINVYFLNCQCYQHILFFYWDVMKMKCIYFMSIFWWVWTCAQGWCLTGDCFFILHPFIYFLLYTCMSKFLWLTKLEGILSVEICGSRIVWEQMSHCLWWTHQTPSAHWKEPWRIL